MATGNLEPPGTQAPEPQQCRRGRGCQACTACPGCPANQGVKPARRASFSHAAPSSSPAHGGADVLVLDLVVSAAQAVAHRVGGIVAHRGGKVVAAALLVVGAGRLGVGLGRHDLLGGRGGRRAGLGSRGIGGQALGTVASSSDRSSDRQATEARSGRGHRVGGLAVGLAGRLVLTLALALALALALLLLLALFLLLVLVLVDANGVDDGDGHGLVHLGRAGGDGALVAAWVQKELRERKQLSGADKAHTESAGQGNDLWHKYGWAKCMGI